MAVSTSKIVGALDTMGSGLEIPSNLAAPATAPDKSSPFPTPVDSTLNQQPTPSVQPYKVPAANENDSVQSRVSGLISKDSDLMKLAAQQGVNYANKRGLVNSSIAAGASQAEMLKAATPIATADANIAAQKNLGREAQSASMEQLRQQLSASDKQQDKDIAAQMTRLKTDAAAQMSRLESQFANANAQQQVDIRAQMDRLNASTQAQLQAMAAQSGYDITKLQVGSGLDIARDAAQARNATDLAKVQGQIQSALQTQGNSEQIQRMGVELANQLQMQSAQLANDLRKIAAAGDQDVRRLVEAANQERVTLQQSIAAQDRDRIATAMVNTFQIEAQMRAALLGNNNIPAAERAAYEKSISALGDPLRVYINQLFGSPATLPPSTVTPAGGPAVITPGGLTTTTGDSSGLISNPDGNADVLNASAEYPAYEPGGLIDNLTPERRRALGFGGTL